MTGRDLHVQPTTFPGQRTFDGEPFPLALSCQTPQADRSQVIGWLQHARADLLQQVERHGAILFRGFPLATAGDFDAFVSAFGLPNFPYDESLSNAVRVNRTERVFTANEAPSDVTIYLHHEMAQTPIFPGKLFFFCEQPAASGGATPLCRSDVLLDQLAARAGKFVRDCAAHGLKYTNVMPPANDASSGMGRSWQSTLRAAQQSDAEQRLHQLGYTWEWLDDGCLRATTPVLPAVHALASGRRSFFNQLIAASKGWKDSRNDPSRSITLGDGSPLDADAVLLAADLAEALIVDIPWQQGDVALVDNFRVMHGRRPFTGVRKVLASLVAAD